MSSRGYMSRRVYKGVCFLLLLIYAAGVVHFVLPLHEHEGCEENSVPPCGFCVLFTTAAVLAPLIAIERLPILQPVTVVQVMCQRSTGRYPAWLSRGPPSFV